MWLKSNINLSQGSLLFRERITSLGRTPMVFTTGSGGNMGTQAHVRITKAMGKTPSRRRVVWAARPKLGKPKRINLETIGPFPRDQAEKIAEMGYRRLLSEGRSEEIAR